MFGAIAKRRTKSLGRQDYGVHTLDEQFMSIYRLGLKTAGMEENSWRRARFFHTMQMLTLTNGIEGVTAEAGCYRGLASFLICEYCKIETPGFDGRGHFMIDSFEGLSAPVEEDGTLSNQRYAEGAFTATSLERCQNTMIGFPNANIIQGWIPKAFEELPEQSYRFVHIDVDIFEPTLDCLRYFYPRMSPGGMIVIDDFGPWPGGLWGGCKIAVEQFSDEFGVPFAKLDTANAVVVKR